MAEVDDPFIVHLQESLVGWGRVDARRMFGGWGVYRGPLIFGLVSSDILYLKSGQALAELAGERRLDPFTHEKPDAKGKKRKVKLSYAAVPTDIMADEAALPAWAEAAYADALANRRGKQNPFRPKKPPIGRRPW